MARILYLTQIDIEHGAVRLLQAECQRIGIRRPLVVSDAGVRAAGVLQHAIDALGDLPRRCGAPTSASASACACAGPRSTCRRSSSTATT